MTRQRRLEKAEIQIDSVNMLCASVSHEMKNPIQGMENFAERIRQELPLDSPCQMPLHMLTYCISMIKFQVSQLLDRSLLSNGRLNLFK